MSDDLQNLFENDQNDSGIEESARSIAIHYRTLIANGVSPEHAMMLTMTYQYGIFAMAQRSED